MKHGVGTYYSSAAAGGVYEGQWEGDRKHGRGKFTFGDGRIRIQSYDAGAPVGQGVGWSWDGEASFELQDGRKGRIIPQDEAAQIAARIGIDPRRKGKERVASVESPLTQWMCASQSNVSPTD